MIFDGATFVCDGKRKTVRSIKQDKGFKEELAQFTKAVSQRGDAPIELSSLVATTLATFAGSRLSERKSLGCHREHPTQGGSCRE